MSMQWRSAAKFTLRYSMVTFSKHACYQMYL